MLPLQQPPGHLNKRTVFDLPSGERGGEPILVPISVPCRLLQSFHHPLNRSDHVETEHNINIPLPAGKSETQTIVNGKASVFSKDEYFPLN